MKVELLKGLPAKLAERGLSTEEVSQAIHQIKTVGDLALAKGHPAMLMNVLGYAVEDFHKYWMDEILGKEKNLLILAPRGHGKSILLANYVIWRIIQNPNIRILVVSATGKQSTDFMSVVQGQFENPDFIEIFGDYRNVKKWNNMEIMVKGRTKIMREATLSVSSYGGAIISRHVDLLIADDVVDEDNARTQTQRELLETWFFKSLTPVLEPNAKTIALGTRWHYEDLYNTLIQKGWRHVIMGTPVAPTFDDIGILNGGDPLWRDQYPIDILRERYIKMGSIFYNSQYFNDPTGMKGQIFEYDWFNWYEDGDAREIQTIWIGVDPASSLQKYADYTAICVIGITKTGDIYVLDIFQGKIPIMTQIEKIREYTAMYKPTAVAIEVNAYQRVLAQHMEALMCPVQEITTLTDKVSRALKIQPYIQNRKLYVKRSMKETLVKQMIQFPKTEKKDMLDSLQLAIEASVGGTIFIKSKDREPRLRESAKMAFFTN